MRQWVFDLGNSRMKCAPLQADGRLGEVRALGYGDDVAGVVQGADEAEAIEAVERLWAGLDLMELSPRLAGLAPLSSAARRAAEDGLRRAGAQGPASGLPALH